MAYVNFNRGLTRAQIEALTNAVNGKIYFATDGGIYVGKADGTAEEKADINDRTESKTGQEFVYRKSAATIKAKSLTLDRIYGKTLAWNQMVANGDFSNGTSGWSMGAQIDATASVSNNTMTLTVTGSQKTAQMFRYAPIVSGHKYYLASTVKPSVSTAITIYIASLGVKKGTIPANTWTFLSGIVTATSTTNRGEFNGGAGGLNAVGDTISYRNIYAVDLTLMFGAGKEPATTAEFEAYFSGYKDQNSGKLISNDAAAVETVGFNVWDEEWRVNGYYISNTTGGAIANSNYSNTGYVPVLPSTTYYLMGVTSGGQWGAYYDANKNFISGYTFNSPGTFTTPANAAYVRITMLATDVSSNICINLSDPAKNGTYEPYRKSTMPLNLNAIKVYSHNIWDEEWESGKYNLDNGEKTSDSTAIRSKNFIPILPSTEYYIKSATIQNCRVCYYDANHNFLSYRSANTVNTTFTSVANAYYITIYMGGTSYSNDICINLSSSFNGQYEPHGILTIEGGLKGAGSVYDEIVGNKYIKRVGWVELGKLEWSKGGGPRLIASISTSAGVKSPGTSIPNAITPYYVGATSSTNFDNAQGVFALITPTSGSIATSIYIADSKYSDAATFKAAMSGVYMDYELATPIEYELAEPIVPTAAAGTTEARISPNSDGLSAPFCCDMTYDAQSNNDSANAQYAATAGRLYNSHKLWGQDFNGTEDVSGALSGVTTLTASDAVTAGSFVKSGGTSSQFLKADGSVDSNTYALNSSLAWNKTQQGGAILVNSGATASDEGTIAYGKTNIADIIASGIGSQAGGFSDEQGLIKAQGNGSRAMGVTQIDGHIIASGHASEAIGFADSDVAQIIASGVGSYARGCGNDGPIFASGKGSTAIGAAEIGTIRASGKGSIAIGNPTGYSEIHAKGNGSFAHGYTNAEYAVLVAYGASSHAEGAADAESISGVSGYGTSYTSSNSGKLSVGDIVFSGFYIAQVVSCTSSSFTTDVTLGSLRNTTIYMQYGAASGDNSHSEGRGTRAIGYASHSEGYYTTAQNAYEHAMGKYNASHKASTTWGNAGNTLHSIGIGTGSSARVNAVEVMQNGDVYINSTGNYDGTNPSTADTLQQQILVLTEHIAKLTAKINTLEAEIDNRGNLTANTVDVRQGYTYNGDLLILTGSGAPTTVPAFVGQFYINTSGPSLYYAINNSAASDWKQA